MSANDQRENSYVLGAAVSLPLTITAASNDKFKFNSVQYVIPAKVYATCAQLAQALNSIVGFKALVNVSVEPGQPTKLRFTVKARGNSTLVFNDGSSASGLNAIGLTDAWVANRSKTGVDGPTSSAYGSVYGPGVFWDGEKYASSEFI